MILLAQALAADPRLLASYDVAAEHVAASHPTPPDADWELLRATLRPLAVLAADPAQARVVIGALLGALGESHHAVWPARAPRSGVPIHLRAGFVEGRLVLLDGPAAGQRLLAVGDDEVGPALARIYATWTEPAERLARVDAWLAEVAIQPATTRGLRVEDGRWVPAVSPVLPPDVLRIDSFDAALPATYAAFFTRNAASPGVVLDLRADRGGIVGMVRGLAGHLVDAPTSMGTLRYRSGPADLRVSPRAAPYSGRVALVVDGLTASAAEVYTAGLQDLGRARVYGERSAGEVLAAEEATLPDGDRLQYAVATYTRPAGGGVEGEGITPDVVIAPTIAALRHGHDLALDAALAWARTGRP